MRYDLGPFEERVKLGYLRKSETDSLILYGYTDKCTFDRAWDEYTTIARGLILEKASGEVIAVPFKKFWNLGERLISRLENLPAETGYTVHEKVDGSLGIIFNYRGTWYVSTRGSFYSPQAVVAQSLLSKYDMSDVDEDSTLLVEIVYPENRIIVDYGATEELVLLGAYNRETCREREETYIAILALQTGMRQATRRTLTINQMVKLKKTLPRQEEGFVVRFGNGLRVKIKGDEYMAVAKMLSRMSPISFWESMVNGIVNKGYLAQLPEELRPRYEPIVVELENQYAVILKEIEQDLERMPHFGHYDGSKEHQKDIGLFIQGNNGIKHGSAIFPVLKMKIAAIDRYILKQIRPTGNQLKDRSSNT